MKKFAVKIDAERREIPFDGPTEPEEIYLNFLFDPVRK